MDGRGGEEWMPRRVFSERTDVDDVEACLLEEGAIKCLRHVWVEMEGSRVVLVLVAAAAALGRPVLASNLEGGMLMRWVRQTESDKRSAVLKEDGTRWREDGQ